jgi:DMSO/TMAO reductase YedYZ molybdopterin-dependent catalytic subunit
MSSLPKNDELPLREVAPRELAAETRRDFLLFGAGAAAAAAGLLFVLPPRVRQRFIGRPAWLDSLEGRRQKAMQGVLTFDDDVAEALYSPARHTRLYSKRDVTPLRNNYNGRTPSPAYLASWKLTIGGLASGTDVVLSADDLRTVAPPHEQVTRICCVEGWSAIAWWSGFRFADLLRAYPPAAGMRWAALESSVNLDGRGHPDPYYVSIDLDTARHPQALLATHHNGAPLHADHGAPLRLVVPMKLGLKNIKAITRIAYMRDEPRDYWAERGYSRYDGL